MKGETTGPDIFLLVKGLSSSDKNYYRKISKRHANKNKALHLRFFKLIEESEVYNEEKLRKTLHIENKIHFSEIKAYLQKDILDTIIFQKRNNSTDTRLSFMQEQIKVLLEKKLFLMAGKLCKKAIALASQYEKYPCLISLLILQNKVLEYSDFKQYKSTSDSAFSRIRDVIVSQNKLTQNMLLYEEIRLKGFHNWLPLAPSELTEIEIKRAILDGLKPVSEEEPVIRLYHLNSLALCQYMLHENKDCNNTCEKIIKVWSAFPHLVNEYAALFLNSIHVTCYNNFAEINLEQVKQNMATYIKLSDAYLKNECYRKNLEIIEFNTRLKLYHKTTQYEQVKILINKHASSILSATNALLSPPDELSILGSVCISYFVLEQWDDAESLLAIMKEKNRKVQREDILYFSLLFYLALLYEKKEWYRMDLAIETTYHFLYTRKRLHPFERGMILFLKRLPSFHEGNEMNDYIARFLQKLNALKISDKQLHFLYFNYYGWLESKIKGMRYMDYMVQKMRRKKSIF